MINLESRRGRRVSLCRLDPRNLHLQEELGHLDGEIAADAADSDFGREVNVQT